ncbi:MAG: hypothetical protein ABW123_05315 [Cystobacter sp.]
MIKPSTLVIQSVRTAVQVVTRSLGLSQVEARAAVGHNPWARPARAGTHLMVAKGTARRWRRPAHGPHPSLHAPGPWHAARADIHGASGLHS